MKIRKTGDRVLWYECVGFAAIIGLSWLDHSAAFARLVFGRNRAAIDWRESAMETVLILLVGLVVLTLTRRLIRHLHYQEGFLRVCAWCRRIGHNGGWVRLEQYFAEGFHVETTHGMCPDCLKKAEEDTTEFKRREVERNSSGQDAVRPNAPAGTAA